MEDFLLDAGGTFAFILSTSLNLLIGGAVLKYAAYLEDVKEVSYLKAIGISAILTFVIPFLIFLILWVIELIIPISSFPLLIIAWPFASIFTLKKIFKIGKWPAFKILLIYYAIYIALRLIFGYLLS